MIQIEIIVLAIALIVVIIWVAYRVRHPKAHRITKQDVLDNWELSKHDYPKNFKI